MNAQKAKDLIAEKGIFGLGDYDGCMCCNFEVCGVSVDISCRKSSGGSMFEKFYGTTIRVHSRHMDSGAPGLQLVAAEVVKQVKEHEGHLPVNLRFCDYTDDHEQKCAYCGKPRSKPEGYLCAPCETREEPYTGRIRDIYAFDSICCDMIEEAKQVAIDP